MNDIELLESIKEIFIHLKNYGWINDIKRDVDADQAIQAIENLINRVKELEEEIKRMKNIDIYKLVEDWETGQLIQKSKIKEKIEELKNPESKFYKSLFRKDEHTWSATISRILQELLEEE